METVPQVKALTPRAIAVGGATLVLIAAALVWLLLALGIGREQLDAIRTAGTLVVGAGGAVALLLAARRQRSTELELQQKYQAAHDTRLDATERRITELYIKAADQLGSDKAPVRLAGLYALERLAQDTPRLRQTIVNVICAYLRMPYDLPTTTTVATEALSESTTDPHAIEARQEREVRLTAQGIIADHLRPGPDPDAPSPRFWGSTYLDLDGATLIDFDLTTCRTGPCRFTGAEFTGSAEFTSAVFAGDADFSQAKFAKGAEFSGAQFTGSARFYRAEFNRLGDEEFAGYAWFGGTRFAGGVSFYEAKFAAGARFTDTKFDEGAQFHKVDFCGTAGFGGAEFTGSASFTDAKFRHGARFGHVNFAGAVNFRGARFEGDVPPEVASFLDGT